MLFSFQFAHDPLSSFMNFSALSLNLDFGFYGQPYLENVEGAKNREKNFVSEEPYSQVLESDLNLPSKVDVHNKMLGRHGDF